MKKILAFAFLSCFLLRAVAGGFVVNAANLPPFCYEINGKPGGIAIEILDQVGQTTGIDFRYRFLPWIRAQLETQVANDALVIPLTRLEERERDYEWIAPLFEYRFVIVTKINAPPIRTLDDLQSLTIGVLRGNPMEARLLQMGLDNIRSVKSEDDLARQLRTGLIDAWVVADLAAKQIYRRTAGTPDELRFSMKIGDPMWVYLAASRGFPISEQRRIAMAVAQLHRTGAIDRIVNKYRAQQ